MIHYIMIQRYIVTCRKKPEEVVFVKEEFLEKKISSKNVHVDYGTMADIPYNAVK